jgi:adenosylhomocysteine nucleosidase
VSPIPEIRPVLVVTGAAFEARIAAGDGVFVICSGGDSSRLRSRLDTLAPSDFRAVISFGLAGGLDPALRTGQIMIADRIVFDKSTWQASPALVRALQSALDASGLSPLRSSFAGVDSTVMDPAGKASLRAASGASAVDMETHVVAGFAQGGKLPWACLRAICDPANRALPPLAAKGLKPDGRVDFAATLMDLARAPRQIPALVRTGHDTAIAVAALRRARRVLGSRFGLGPADLR